MQNNICKAPFFSAEIFGNGDVFLCCPAYTKIDAIGNIYEQEWDDIWNGKTAQDFRNKIKQGDYSSCYTHYCSANFFPLCQELKYVDSDKLDIDNPKPRIIKLSMDVTCNVACKICRKEVFCNDPKRTEFLDSKIDKILPILKDVEIVNFTGVGDPFASKHVRKFIKIIAQTYPQIRFNFHTNGTLCNKQNLEELGVLDRLSTVEISLHSAAKETYDKIVRFGNWEKLNKNLEFLSDLIDKKSLDELQLNFVILSENYKDIPAFIELCKRHKAKAFLWQYRDWGGAYDFDSVDVFSPLHKDHKNFIQIMSQLDTSNPNLFMTPALKKYTQIKNVEEYSLYASIFALQSAQRYESKDGIFRHKFKQIEQNKTDIEKLKNKIKANFFEKIFSVKNEINCGKKRKIISILGIRIKLKCKNK